MLESNGILHKVQIVEKVARVDSTFGRIDQHRSAAAVHAEHRTVSSCVHRRSAVSFITGACCWQGAGRGLRRWLVPLLLCVCMCVCVCVCVCVCRPESESYPCQQYFIFRVRTYSYSITSGGSTMSKIQKTKTFTTTTTKILQFKRDRGFQFCNPCLVRLAAFCELLEEVRNLTL